MSDLARVLAKYFRMPKSVPCLPILVKTWRSKWSRNVGRRTLARVLGELGFRTGIEIGTYKGESALEWCRRMPGLHLTCVDPYVPYHGAEVRQDRLDRWFKGAQHTFEKSGYDIDLWRMSSRDAVSRFADASVDFVYIDGDHTFDAVMLDLLQYAPKVRPGGVIALHDYCRVWDGGVMDAVDAYTRNHGISPWYVTYDFAPTAFWQRGAEAA